MGRSPAAANSSQEAESVDLHRLPVAHSISSQEAESSDTNLRPVEGSVEEMDRIYASLPPLEGVDVNLPPAASSFQETVGSSAGDRLNPSMPSNPSLGDQPKGDWRGKEVIDLDSDGDENNGSGGDPMDEDVELFEAAMDLMAIWQGERPADSVEERGEGSGKLVIDDEWLSVGMRAKQEADLAGYGEHDDEERQMSFRREQFWINERAERRARFKSTAIRLAPQLAVSKEEDKTKASLSQGKKEEEEEAPDEPFSIAKKIVIEQEAARRSVTTVLWRPSSNGNRLRRIPPSLKDLCLNILAEHSEAIESLEGIPETLKHPIVSTICRNRKMSAHILDLYLHGSPTEIHISDCSWAKEEVFEKALTRCDTSQLMVVQFDICGRCLPDYVLRSTLARSPNSLTSLTAICLKGAYRLSDDGLNALITSAPSLRSINLGQCSLLTSRGISNLAHKMNSVLRELCLDECQNVDAMVILPSLKKLKCLEVLSVASVPNVCDNFVCELLPFCGASMKELVFADCQELTVASIEAVGANCPNLCALDIQKLHRLDDSAMKYLANGCRSLKSLKLRRNMFSDEATAAFLEASGGSLTELSLNYVGKVSSHTAAAISRQCCVNLQSLDLSFCRELTDEQLGLIVDSCSNLNILKLFGCTQITEFFFGGHSNSQVKIIGLKGSILEHIEMPNFR